MSNHKYFLGNQVNAENYNKVKQIGTKNNKFAEHMFNKNRIVEAFAMSIYGGLDILKHPMCGKCEQPGWLVGDETFKTAENANDKELDILEKLSTNDISEEKANKLIKQLRPINCYCEKCGSITKNTITLREYLEQELKMQLGGTA